jgi:hypothetical protein
MPTFIKAALVAILLTAGGAARALDTEISFYYPIAVGGPVARAISKLVEEFESEHPGIRVKPIYTGTYKDSIAKALTAHRSGNPPDLAVLFAVDMYTLIDADAIVPFDELVDPAGGKAWLQDFHPALMSNSRAAGKTWGIPFQRSTILLYWNKKMFREAGLDPERPPQTWAEMADFARKLTRRDAAGNVTRWGLQIPSSGFPYWLFQGLVTANGTSLMNAGRDAHLLRPSRRRRGASILGGPLAQGEGEPARRRRVGHDARAVHRQQGRHDLDHQRQPRRPAREGRLRSRRGRPARQPPARLAHRRRQFLHLPEEPAGRTARGAHLRAMDGRARAHRALGHCFGLHRGEPACLGDAADAPAHRCVSPGGGRP